MSNAALKLLIAVCATWLFIPLGLAQETSTDTTKTFAAKILAGARNEAIKQTPYHEEYHVLTYPGGDVPANQGVCTDLIIRAFRNAGLDLQKELHEDRTAHPSAYPTQIWDHKKADRNIDHRRCQNLTVWFKRHAQSRTLASDADHLDQWLPGDVVFFVRKGQSHPWHVAILSDKHTPDGMPLIIDSFPPCTGETHRLDDFLPVFSHFRFIPNPTSPQ